jgi:NAD(P)H-hydrate epimerase
VTLPDWLEPLPDAELMRATDRWAIEEQGVPSLDLMERAGEGLARLAASVAGGGPVVVVCGKGNNGGDGLVVGRILRAQGLDVRVLLLDPELKGDAAANLERVGEWSDFEPSRLDGAAVVVDAVLGTGFEGEPREPALGAIEAMNACEAPVVAADVPSGVNASTGEVVGAAVRVAATATFHSAKPGLWIEPGKTHAGEVHVVDIGIPRGAPGGAEVGLIREAVLEEIPRRERGSTKFDSGHVLVCGGSPGLTGAPSLAADAAMRAGAGYVTACVPTSLSQIFETRLLEVMTAPLEVDEVLERAERGGAMVVGPGMGRLDDAQELARELARRAELPLVLDADGLNAHAERLADLRERSGPTVLTPHEGELGRLLGVESATIKARRLHHAREAAQASGATVVLKGDDTLIAEPGGRVAVNPGATAALATAGTGDVLSGVLGAILAKGVEPFTAACAAVHLHARAGIRAAKRVGPEGVIASDVIAALPGAREGRT